MLTRVLTQVYTRVPTKVGFLCVRIPYKGSHSSAHVSAHTGAHASVHEVVWSYVFGKGKYGCRKVRVYPTECGEQFGRDPSKHGSSKSFVLERLPGRRNTLGLIPSSHPHSLGYACTLYAPTSPLLNVTWSVFTCSVPYPLGDARSCCPSSRCTSILLQVPTLRALGC